MDYKELKNWIENKGTYADGVTIYAALGNNAYFKTNLFTRPESAFVRDKLYAELLAIYKTTSPIIEVPVIEIKPKVIETKREYKGLDNNDFFNLPRDLQEKRLKIGSLYGEVMQNRKKIRQQLALPSKGVLSLQEAYHVMGQITGNNKPVPFKLAWITYNEDTGQGGDLKELDCVIKWGNRTGSRFKPLTPADTVRKDARHDIHGTFNVQISNTIEVRKVHTWLIFQVNGYDIVIGQ